MKNTELSLYYVEKLKTFPLRSRTREGCPLSLLVNITQRTTRVIRQDKYINTSKLEMRK